MRYRIKKYSASVSNNVVTLSFDVPDGMAISINPDDGSLDPADERFIKESVRLIIDETNKIVLCSSMQKDRIINIYAQGIQCESIADTIYIYIAIPDGKIVSASDQFTVEFDWGTPSESLAKQGNNADATLTAVLEALKGGDEPSPDIPEGVAERLAMILEFFGIKTISGYTFMTDKEVTDEIEDIMQALDNELTPEQAAAITAEAMQIIVRA